MYLYLVGGGILHFGRVVVGFLLGLWVVFFLAVELLKGRVVEVFVGCLVDVVFLLFLL